MKKHPPNYLKIGRLTLVVVLLWSCTERKETAVDSFAPDPTRFVPVVITPPGALDEPMMFEVLPDESVFIIERGGALKKWDAATATMKEIARFPVFTDSEQGLVGLALDPAFETNHWIYLYYAPTDRSNFILARWEVSGDSLVASSQRILLEVPSDREGTSHTGGGMTWDKSGNLYLTVGNNTGNSMFSQTDERPDRAQYDDQRGAANTNDLRGKILRIHPEPDGTYSIPEGNLFPAGTDKTRPEIFVMGNRNPWRVSLDSKTGYLYWGEIGPDADRDSEQGPMGYDELNQARKAGFFGWPYFIGENNAYPMYDYVKGMIGAKQDPANPFNRSRHNTGLTDLPPAQPAFISYPYRPSEKFPLVGSSSRCAIGGPVYHRSDFAQAVRPFPEYFEGKWLAADLSRFWIMAISMDGQGNYAAMERFAPDYHPRQPIDIKFGPTGDLYVLEYGGNTANSPTESQLVRIEYNAGNRKPEVVINVDKRGGLVPLVVKFNSEGTRDFDGDAINYQWTVINGTDTLRSSEANPTLTLRQEGVYRASLQVTDQLGLSNTAEVNVMAGNDPPNVHLVLSGNQTFFFPGESTTYEVSVHDHEDGSLIDHRIAESEVAFSVDYLSEGFDYAALAIEHGKSSRFAIAQGLMAKSDCRTCHNESQKGVGPTFDQIATKYQRTKNAYELLVDKIRNGSSGVWGMETAMPAHPLISPANARVIVNYILNHTTAESLPLAGAWKFPSTTSDNGRGSYVWRVAYADHGLGTLPSLAEEQVLTLRSPRMLPILADEQQGVIRDQLDEYTFLTARPQSHIAYRAIDLTNIQGIHIQPNWHLYDIYKGGKIEVHLDQKDGPLVGETDLVPKQFNVRYRGAFAPPPGSADKGVEIDSSLPPLDYAKFFGPGSDKSMFTIASKISLREVEGIHDVYFVFSNPQAKPEESLFPLAYIEFVPKKKP